MVCQYVSCGGQCEGCLLLQGGTQIDSQYNSCRLFVHFYQFVKCWVFWVCVLKFPGLALRDCNFGMLCCPTLYVHVLSAQLSYSLVLTKLMCS